MARGGVEPRAACTGSAGQRHAAPSGARGAGVDRAGKEPFGLVALEAAAAGAPLAVAATGGLAEIVEPGGTGLTFRARDTEGLAGSLSSLISDRQAPQSIADAAPAMVGERDGGRDVGAGHG